MKNLFKNKSFRYLWFSQIMSQITINVMNFLVIVRVYEQTHSPLASSGIWIAYALPAMLVGPIGAATVDIADRRKILMLATVSQSVIILVYSFAFDISLVLSYVVVFFYSLFNQFYVPAESASLPYLVPKKELIEANSVFFLSQQVSLLVAFVVAGVIAETLGLRIAFILSSILLLLACISAFHLPRMEVTHIIFKGTFPAKVLGFLEQVLEGFRFIFKNTYILLPFLFLLSIWTLMGILTVNLPLIGEQIVKVKPSLAGIAIVLPAAIGALTGSTLLSKYDQKVLKRTIVQTSMLILGLVFLVVPLVVPLLNFWAGRTLVVVAFYLAGLGYVGTLVPSLTYIQEVTPKDMTGRVLGYFWFVSSIIGILPVIFSATITQFFGISTLLILFGGIALCLHLVMRFIIPRTAIKPI
jgi:MFS family permease